MGIAGVIEKINTISIGAVLLASAILIVPANSKVFAAPNALNVQHEERDSTGSSEIAVNGSDIGPSNKLYQVGRFENAVDFDPTSGQDTAPDLDEDSGLIRWFNSNGSYGDTLVLADIAGEYETDINHIVFTADKSKYYITGTIYGDVDFDFGAGTETRSATTSNGNAFIARYSSSDNSLDEVRMYEGISENHKSYISDIALNPNGSSFAVFGSFGHDIDLNLSDGEDSYTSDSEQAGFIATYDTDDFAYINSNVYNSEEDGLEIDVTAAAYTSEGYLYYAVETYNNNNEDDLLVTFDSDPTDEGTNEITQTLDNNGSSTFIVKAADDGTTYVETWEFASTTGKFEYGDYYWISQMEVDSSDNLYWSGAFEGSIDFNPESETNDEHSSVNGAGFVTKMEEDGDYGYTYMQTGTDTSSGFYDLEVGNDGSVFALGGIWTLDGSTTVDIDPSDGVNSKYIQDEHALFVRLNTSGAQTLGYISGYSNSDAYQVSASGGNIELDGNGNIFTTAGVWYTYDKQDSENCEINEQWVYGTGTAKFADTGAALSGWLDFTALPQSYVNDCDGDGDGVSDAEELSNPHTDANDDGDNDSEQADVAAIINPVTGELAAISAEVDNEDCELNNVSIQNKASAASGDNYEYPLGLFDFQVACSGDQGFTATIRQYYYNPPEGDFIIRKSANGEFLTITDAAQSIETYNGEPVLLVTYEVTDGGELDADGEENGVIVDPAGPATLGAITDTPAPTGNKTASGDLGGTGIDAPIYMLAAVMLTSLGLAAVIQRKRTTSKKFKI